LLLAALTGVLLLATACITVAQPSGWAGPSEADGRLVIHSEREKLAAVDIGSLEVAWEFPGKGQEHDDGSKVEPQGIYGNPTIADGTVYFGAYDGWLYAVDLASGDLKWEDDLGGHIIGGATVAEGLLYVGSSNNQLHALDPASGAEQWRFLTGDDIWATPLVADGVVYLASMDKKLYALDAADGSERWDKPFSADGGLASTPVLVDGTLLVGGFDRRLYAVDASSGEEKWSFKAGNWFWTRSLVEGEAVYAGSLDGNLYALGLADGKRLWSYDLKAPVRAAPVLVGDTLLVAGRNGLGAAHRAGEDDPGRPLASGRRGLLQRPGRQPVQSHACGRHVRAAALGQAGDSGRRRHAGAGHANAGSSD
jgi:outer membrane protein assembly factor BamB